jgi:poly(A) polymerase/tRNA nucleotidyltransferase (CCA-adding enzyme)
VAELPLPRDHGDGDGELSLGEPDPGELHLGELPTAVRHVLAMLIGAGHEVAVVGGALRERLHDGAVTADDWDVATSADPEAVAALFPTARWLNRFGTVTVPGTPLVEVTAFRTEGAYRDRRRPDDVRFGATLAEDLARRDFTINAMAWQPTDLDAGHGRLVDPFGGGADLEAGILRAVGDPEARFAEDALRIIRGARFAAGLGLRIDPPTAAALRALAPTLSGVSGERLRDELLRMLSGPVPPSGALRQMEALGILPVVLPEVAALRGVPQAKLIPGDALDHTMRAVDAAPAEPLIRVATLLHDIGKATTLAGGHFIGHERVGADLAARVLQRLRFPAAEIAAVEHAIRHHMFAYEPNWTDAAVRRFLRRVGPDRLELLLALRRADNLASGVGEAGDAAERALVERIRRVGAAHPAILAGHLAIDGNDVQAALGIGPSPAVGTILDALLERVLDDPALNDRATLLALARSLAAGARSPAE